MTQLGFEPPTSQPQSGPANHYTTESFNMFDYCDGNFITLAIHEPSIFQAYSGLDICTGDGVQVDGSNPSGSRNFVYAKAIKVNYSCPFPSE